MHLSQRGRDSHRTPTPPNLLTSMSLEAGSSQDERRIRSPRLTAAAALEHPPAMAWTADWDADLRTRSTSQKQTAATGIKTSPCI